MIAVTNLVVIHLVYQRQSQKAEDLNGGLKNALDNPDDVSCQILQSSILSVLEGLDAPALESLIWQIDCLPFSAYQPQDACEIV